jgi:hypothetical protein
VVTIGLRPLGAVQRFTAYWERVPVAAQSPTRPGWPR